MIQKFEEFHSINESKKDEISKLERIMDQIADNANKQYKSSDGKRREDDLTKHQEEYKKLTGEYYDVKIDESLEINEDDKVMIKISGIAKGTDMLKKELKMNNVQFKTDGNSVIVEDSPKTNMAIKMVKERCGMQSINSTKINESFETDN